MIYGFTKKIENVTNEEIDFKQIFLTFKREKKLIFIVILISTILSTIYSFTTKPIWKGSFNIVVSNEKDENQNLKNSFFEGVLNNLDDDENETQRLILKSPSVLKPVFEYVKNHEKQKGNDVKDFSFKKWIEGNLEIDYEKNSSVLTIEYKNTDKQHILNVLNLISNKYQDYSKKETEKNITKTINYLESQTALMKEKSLSSQREFNKFSIDNGLGNIDGFVGLGKATNKIDNDASSILGLTNLSRTGLSGLSFKSLGNLDNPNDAGQRFKKQFIELEKLEAEYVNLSLNLKPSSKVLNKLKMKIDNLRSSLRRPNEILLEYKTLRSTVNRNRTILAELENNLEIMKLQKIRNPDPWEMISIPTLDTDPVSPKKKEIFIVSIILSTLLGFILSLIKEKKSDIIYNFDELISYIPYDFIETIYEFNNELNSKIIGKLSGIDKKNKIAIIELSNDFLYKSNMDTNLKDDEFKYELITKESVQRLFDFQDIILIAKTGVITRKNIKYINNFLLVHKEKIKGWFFLDEKF